MLNSKKDSINYLLSIESKGIKLGLQRTKNLSMACGNPHKDLKIIQIAGTNGKGSTCAILSNILRKANYKVGLFTSPHLVNINERIRIDGVPITDSDIHGYLKLYKNDIEKHSASFFETVTIMAFWYFKKNNVDYAIMETGLGGRLDSVTICNPVLTIITSISIDHSEILGNTLTKITHEKVGIIKPRIPCITIQHTHKIQKIIRDECRKKKSPLIISDNINSLVYDPQLQGAVQYENAKLAETAIYSLKLKNIKTEHIICGIETVNWPGRNQIIQTKPLVIFDVAHNESGIKNFLKFFHPLASGKKILILSIQKRKKIDSQINNIIDLFDEIILCETSNDKTMKTIDLKLNFPNLKKIKCISSNDKAINYVLDNVKPNDSIAIIGTHFLGDAVSRIFNISFNLL